MKNLQNRDWQYLIESLIYKTEKNKDYYKIKTTEDSKMIRDMTKNYKLLRTIHHDFYNFQYYLGTLTQSDFNDIDADIVASRLNSLQNVDSAKELLMLFDFFYFANGKFPTTATHTLNGEELNIKKLYEKFRTTNSHALLSSQYLAALNIFFVGDPKLSRRFLTEFYQNMTVSTLSTDDAFSFDTFTDLSTSINLSLRRQTNENINSIKVEDDDTISSRN